MSHTAIKYVKKLRTAPDGSKIRASEKAVLMALADSHNADFGCAWPSMKELARQGSMSERNCRRIIERLENEGVIQRSFTRREEGGGQSSNEYSFPALGAPAVTPKLAEQKRKLQRVARIPMSRAGGQRRQTPTDKPVLVERVATSGGPGRGRPTIEPLGEHLDETLLNREGGTFPPTPHNNTWGVNFPKSASPEKAKSPFINPDLARMAWNSVSEDLRGGLLALLPRSLENRPGFTNGAEDWQSFRFNDVRAEFAKEDELGAMTLVISSPDPEATKRGINKYQIRIARTLSGFYGRATKLEIQHRE